jgi:AGCS family alanine or glycine:cation symporter
MDFIQANLIDPISKVLYTYVLIYVLVAVGIYFTIRTRFVQIRYFGRMLNQVLHSRTSGDGIS